jgi:hypothetical protein
VTDAQYKTMTLQRADLEDIIKFLQRARKDAI